MRHWVTFTRNQLATRSNSARCTERARPDENSDYWGRLHEPVLKGSWRGPARRASQTSITLQQVHPKKQAGEIKESWSDVLPCFTSKDLTATIYVTGLQEQRDNTQPEGDKTLCRGEGDIGEGRHRQRAYSSCFAAFVGLNRCSCSLVRRASEPMRGFEDDLLSQHCFVSNCYRYPALAVGGFFFPETGRVTSLFGTE
jgi:hypothetical protein